MAVLPKSHISVMVLGFFSFLCEQLNDIYFLHFFFFLVLESVCILINHRAEDFQP